MTRIHNIAVFRVLSIIIAFSIFYHVTALATTLSSVEIATVIVVPLLVILTLNMSSQRPTLWLLIPFTLYLADRFFVYVWIGIEGLNRGLSPLYANDTLGILYQVNAVRFVAAIAFTLIMISLITAGQKEWFYKMHRVAILLLLVQFGEIILWLFSDFVIFSPSFIEYLLVTPGLLYFPLFMIMVTRLHLYEIYVEKGLVNESAGKETVRLHQKQSPQNEAPRPTQNVSQRTQSKPTPPPVQTSPPKQVPPKQSTPQRPPEDLNIVCPLCGTVNSKQTFCKKCGQTLKAVKK